MTSQFCTHKPSYPLSIVIALLFASVGGLLTSCSSGKAAATTIATPLISPASGTFFTKQTVTITDATAGTTIYYSTDGSTPTSSSIVYSGAFTVASSETVNAIAQSGTNTSSVATAQYVLNSPITTTSAASYTFPADVVGNALTETVATIKNSGAVSATIAVGLTGPPSFSFPAATSTTCRTQLAVGATCTVAIRYLPAAAGTADGVVTVSNTSGVAGSIVIALTATATAVPAGSIASTAHPLVAQYTVTPQSAANVTVEFGTDTSYGLTTSTAASSGSAVSLLVGGMRADTTYHMRAIIAYADGGTVTNEDQTFKTGSLPANLAALNLTATTAAGMSPQPGIELMDPVNAGPYQPYAVDLQGNVIWYYPWTDYQSSLQLDGIKQMTNGDYIAVIGVLSSQPLTSAADPSLVMIREFDLAGNTVKQLTLAQLNSSLASAGYPIVLADFHHDITVLPNGHWLILSNTLKQVSGTNVLGDVVVDVDTDMNPKFVWNEFDYFDTSRQPMMYPDWTHSNAVVYSPSDGNFLVSIRHQNWVVKVNYQNGAGDGSVLWKLGYQGNFTLENGTDPIDWQYAQHYPSFVGTATSGVFNLVLMDNGNDRIVSGLDGLCGVGGNVACYSTVPTFQVDETAMTATIESRITFPTSLYSYFAGNAEVLANNDVEYDLCGVATGSVIQEVLPDADHTLVWSLVANGNSEYRAFRLPSLYPNVQWPLPLKVNAPINPRDSKGRF